MTGDESQQSRHVFRPRWPRAVRLRRSEDFATVSKRGRRFQLADLVVIAWPGSAGSRFGLAVGRKVGGAVVRNRVKRRLREGLRHERARLLTGWDVVIIARPSAATASAAALRMQVVEAFERIGSSRAHPGASNKAAPW